MFTESSACLASKRKKSAEATEGKVILAWFAGQEEFLTEGERSEFVCAAGLVVECRNWSKTSIHCGSLVCLLRKTTFPLDKSLLRSLGLICLDRGAQQAAGNFTEKAARPGRKCVSGALLISTQLALTWLFQGLWKAAVPVCAVGAVQVLPLQQERRFQHPPCPGILQGSTEGIRVVWLLPGTHINITGVACAQCSLLLKQLHLILISGYYISLAVSLSCEEHQSEDSSAT